MKVNVEFLPKGVADPLFEQRESGRAHTPYEAEVAFYGCIKDGDSDALKRMFDDFLDSALIVGRMSNDNLRQAQYFAVSCITLAVRYAIEGGLEQSVAYNLSDKYILHVDSLTSKEEIIFFLTQKAVELADMVKECKYSLKYPPHIKKAVKFIDAHLHEKLTVTDVAKACGVSSDYLSAQFKKHTNDSLSHYIMRTKLESSKKLLLQTEKYDYSEIGYYFGFCSETYYITCFKKEYGITPKQYVRQHSF